MLKWTIYITVFYFFYKIFLAPMVRTILTPLKKPKAKQRRPPPSQHSKEASHQVEVMHKCPTCSTYNPTSMAIFFNHQYFCNEQCRKDFTKVK